MISEINAMSIYSAITSADSLKAYQQNFEKLSSGSKLNRASDGAAEIAISNLLKADLASVDQGIRNVRDGVSMLQIADSSLETVSKNLTRMKELTTQAGSDLYSPEQKKLIQQEFDQLAAQNTQIGQTTTFNGIRLHANNQTISITADGEQAAEIQSKAIPQVSANVSDFKTTISSLDQIIEYINAYRADLGSHINTLQVSADSLNHKAEEILKSESRISDTDVAATAAALASSEIIAEQAMASQAQANTSIKATSTLLQK